MASPVPFQTLAHSPQIGGQLSSECRHKQLAVPACLEAWVDLTQLYRRHYTLAPTGGLAACVQRVGLTFFAVCGGPYGIEETVGAAGARMTLLGLLLLRASLACVALCSGARYRVAVA